MPASTGVGVTPVRVSGRGLFMDIATSLGLIAGGIVLVTLIMMGGDLRMFADTHAAIVIFGGSFAATLIRFPLSSIFHGLPLGAKFAFTMRRITQRDLVDEIAGARRGRPQAGADRARKGRDRGSVPGQGHPLRRRRLRQRLHPRQPRARPRQLPDPSRRRAEDLSRDRRLRAGLRHDRHLDRHGADVRQHDRSVQARPLHGGRVAGDVLRRGGRQSVLPADRRQAAPQAGRRGDQSHPHHRRRADDPRGQEPDAGARDAARLSAGKASSPGSRAPSRFRPEHLGRARWRRNAARHTAAVTAGS